MPKENEKQLTAVEWLFDKLQPLLSEDGDLLESATMAYAVAKTKERQQLIDFSQKAFEAGIDAMNDTGKTSIALKKWDKYKNKFIKTISNEKN